MTTRVVRPPTSPTFVIPPPPEVHNIASRTNVGVFSGAPIGHSSPGTFDFTVGVDGTLQQIMDQSTAALTNKRVRIPSGTVWTGPNGAALSGLNKDYGGCTVVWDNGAVVRGGSGIEMYGSCRNLTLQCLTPGGGHVQGDGTYVFSEGIIIDATRGDKGADGAPCHHIVIDGLTVEPTPGTGALQRNGIALWAGDMLTIKNCTIHDCASNAFAGFGSAGSGISCGVSRRTPGAGSPRVLIDNNHIYNVLEIQDGVSADRNGIILDIYHGNFAKYPDYLIGDVVISNNDIHDVSGRGIQDLCGGLSDALVSILGNQVHGQWARRLGGSAPETGIGGYGAGTCGNVIISNNTVTVDPGNGGKPCYYVISFDGDGPGVFGSNNHIIGGGFVAWDSSRTNTPPAGFIT